MDIALAFICLRDEEISNMSTNPVLITDSVTAKNLLKANTESANMSYT